MAADHLENSPEAKEDNLFNAHLPINFLYRHAIELDLKSAVVIFHKRLKLPYGDLPYTAEPMVRVDGQWLPCNRVHGTAQLWKYVGELFTEHAEWLRNNTKCDWTFNDHEDENVQRKRYGFHGLSYEYIASLLPQYDTRAASGRTVVAHLGSGSSLCALDDRRSIATTMSFSTLDGLMMGTRCGTIDPGVILYLLDHHRLSAADVRRLLYEQSGLLGVSGITSDMRELLASPDPRAAEAVDCSFTESDASWGAWPRPSTASTPSSSPAASARTPRRSARASAATPRGSV
jgi:hypothetical protein